MENTLDVLTIIDQLQETSPNSLRDRTDAFIMTGTDLYNEAKELYEQGHPRTSRRKYEWWKFWKWGHSDFCIDNIPVVLVRTIHEEFVSIEVQDFNNYYKSLGIRPEAAVHFKIDKYQ